MAYPRPWTIDKGYIGGWVVIRDATGGPVLSVPGELADIIVPAVNAAAKGQA